MERSSSPKEVTFQNDSAPWMPALEVGYSHRRKGTTAKVTDFNSKCTKLEGKQDLEILQPSTLFKHLESEQPSMEEHSQCPQLPWLCGWVEMPLHLVSPPGAPQTQQSLVVAAATKPCGATGLSPRVTSSCTRALQGLVWPPSLLENDISVLLAAF